MALPLPRVVADVGPGGPLVTSMGGINSLANDMNLRKISSVKAKYAPLTTQAEAASKLAYANLMAPQFLAKLMGNSLAMGNLSDDQIKKIMSSVYSAGTGQGAGQNIFSRMQQENMGEGEKLGNKFSDFLSGHIRNIFGDEQKQPNFQGQDNPLARPDMGVQQPAMGNQSPLSRSEMGSRRPQNGVLQEGQQWYDKEGNPVYDEGEVSVPGQPTVEMELNTGARPRRERTPAEKAGDYEGIIKEGAELGVHRAQVINDIGEQQLQLSSTGANLDRIIDDINDPKFIEMRNDFPFYQDMQLTALSKIGSPEQQEMIGNFIGDIKSFAGATVNSFKGASMKREFEYADQLKPNENDTVNTARGKLTALKALKEIAERKNNVILDLMQDRHMNIGDAVKIANKVVDVKAIDKQVRELTAPMITLEDPTDSSIQLRLPLWEARQRGVKNV